MNLRYCYLIALIVTLAFAAAAAFAAPARKPANSSMVANCKADLAKRLKIGADQITLVESQPTSWPDAALGMPEPGKMYAQMITPGLRVILEARSTKYLYTTGAKAFRYAGPVALWSQSLLYTKPVADEPNLNGDLYQCSLLGTNCVRVASGVSDFYPQANGAILYTQRTSRSGFDLYYLKVGKNAKPTKLDSEFAFASAALNDSQNKWAAIVGPGLGLEWKVAVSSESGEKTENKVFPVPNEVRFDQIAWSGDKVMILGKAGERMVCYEISPSDAKPEWKAVQVHEFPGLPDYMLNKSESLEIREAKINPGQAVEVAKVWFTGDRNVVARIEGVTLRGDTLLAGGFAFIWGEKDSKPVAYTVDISTGEVIPASGIGDDIKPFIYPPKKSPLTPNKR